MLPEAHPLSVARLKRRQRCGLPALVGLLILPAGGYIYHGLACKVWGWSLVGWVLASTAGFLVWHSVVYGQVTSTRGGIYRHTRPYAFWSSVSLLVGVYAWLVAALFFSK
jgi:hypothetical protein